MIKSTFKVACIQLNTKQSIRRNLRHSIDFILEAISKQAQLIITPETTNFMSSNQRDLTVKAVYEKNDVFLNEFKKIAYDNSVWILIGSLVVKDLNEKIFNRSYLISDKGKIVSKYDKIHMFDVIISNKEKYKESACFTPGKKIISYTLPWGKLGMSICYDLRFPGLYRKLSQQGSIFLAVPSAFTKLTGKKHWLSLLKARAIENGAFIFAPAQCGTNSIKRKTYGHSIIINPCGEILASTGSKPGIIYAKVKPYLAGRARKIIPSLLINKKY